MADEEKIRQLQEELNQLNEQVKKCQQGIYDLQNRLIDFTGNSAAKPFKETKKEYQHAQILENFIGLRLIHFAGIIVLVIGLSIGVKYAIDRNLISEQMRIAMAYGAGLVLFILSLRLKNKYILFSAILFSGAMASLYFTTYASFVYYGIFSFATAFVIMIALTVYTIFQAIKYNHSEIALLGLTGAYGIPFLISHNSERADLYFLYISLINIAIVILYIKKEWKGVGRIANIITWLLFLGWCSVRYNIRLERTGIFFLLLFFLLFVFTAISLKLLRQRSLTSGDNNYVTINNIALYAGAIMLSSESHNGSMLAMITLLMSFLTLFQSLLARYIWHNETRIIKALASLSLLLFVLFIAFQWKGFTVTILWLVTSVLLFVFGMIMKWGNMRMASIVLMGITLFKLVVFDSLKFTPVEKVISYISLGILLLFVSFFYQKFKGQLFIDEK
ncbi:MAG TPA: DUF2339 domain-containing protein [Flavisolibacter sp.]|nr:DUF2339 domain-containing protein [Flavisolibacter sp.]